MTSDHPRALDRRWLRRGRPDIEQPAAVVIVFALGIVVGVAIVPLSSALTTVWFEARYLPSIAGED